MCSIIFDGMIFKTSSQLNSVRPLKDGSMSLTFHTQELNIDDKIIVMGKLGSQGWLLFKENDFDEKEIPKDNAKYEGMTPSQKLRWAIKKYWEKFLKDKEPDFERSYRIRMDKLAENYLNKL